MAAWKSEFFIFSIGVHLGGKQESGFELNPLLDERKLMNKRHLVDDRGMSPVASGYITN
jgi:hypothetical protein